MALNKENILTLIGKGRYHSAILTTFSFDFYFFEMKAMKYLRSCGVRNVNVLIDGHYYAELMDQSSGQEMTLTPGYSLYPIFQQSIFHPKIWMLFGEKEGLLIIGSGNLTSAGNGNNEEIWGAFHFSIQDAQHAPIFSTVWQYLQNICTNLKGLIKEKTTHWIVNHAKWVEELPKTNFGEFYEIAGNDKVAFLSNQEQSTIWKQMSTLIDQEEMLEITLLSPYYDTNGTAIQALKAIFPHSNINVVLDSSGAIPARMPGSEAYTFYNWHELGLGKPYEAKLEGLNVGSKLHAKIIHFKTLSGTEYCLFGSANITPQGLGIPGFLSNSEASLFLQSANGGLLEQLGIKLEHPIHLSSLSSSSSPSIYDSIIQKHQLSIKLLSVEWLNDELLLFIEGIHTNPLILQLFDRDNRVLKGIKIDLIMPEMRINLKEVVEGVHYVELLDAVTNKAVSNKILLTHYWLLARTHPNPNIAKFDELYQGIQNGALVKLLDLLPFAISDDTESTSILAHSSAKSAQALDAEPDTGMQELYQLSSYTNKDSNAEQKLLFSSYSLRVLEVIKFINTKEFAQTNETELLGYEQETDIASISGVDETELETAPKNTSYKELEKEKRKLLKYFDQLYKHQQKLLYPAKQSANYHPSLTDLSRYLIALELILEYGGKSATYIEDGAEYRFNYLDLNGDPPYYNDSVKGCGLNLIGDFVYLVRHGFKTYEFEYTIQKVQKLKQEALTASILVLLNTKWRESELRYFYTLILNCLHYLGDKSPASFNKLWSITRRSILARMQDLKHPSNALKDNLARLETFILPVFTTAISKLNQQKFEQKPNKGEIIYKSPWGYCYVREVSSKNEITLVRPGFHWNDVFGDFMNYNKESTLSPKLQLFIRVMSI